MATYPHPICHSEALEESAQVGLQIQHKNSIRTKY